MKTATLFTDEDILRLDEKYAHENIPFHARPLAAAFDILGEQFILDLVQNPAVEDINKAYKRLILEVEKFWPGAGVGLVASMDQVRKITIGLMYSNEHHAIDQLLGFKNHEEWVRWCRDKPDIAARSCYAFADISDFITGINHMEATAQGEALQHWTLAAAHLEELSNSMSISANIASATQPICVIAELAMKGTLYYLGVPKKEIVGVNHRHKDIAARLAVEKPHRDDDLIADIVERIPSYVGTRYSGSNLTRLESVNLALDVQFIAASSLRRVSEVDHAIDFESGSEFPGQRRNLFSK